MADKSDLPVELLRMTDLFIYQPVAARHGIYATDNLKKYLPPRCVQISFPYLYNDALWPLFEEGEEIKGKEAIVYLIESGLSLKEIADKFCTGQIDFQFERRFRETIAILRSKEAITDIKVADFIVSRLATERLFLTQNHQTSSLYIHCVNQMLTLLNLPNLTFSDRIHPNEAGLPDCWPQSPYEIKFYRQQYLCEWQKFHSKKQDSNWHRFYLNTIGKIYLSYPMPWFAKIFWKVYLRLRIKKSLFSGKGYMKEERNFSHSP